MKTRRKLFTIAYKVDICKQALASSVTAQKFAESLEISNTTLRTWLKEYEAGELKEEIPLSEISGLIVEEGNGLIDPNSPEQLEIIVVIDDNTEKIVKVDDPEIKDYDENIAEIKRRAYSQFQILIKV